MQPRNIKVLGTGKYLPETIVTAAELDQRLGLPAGWVAQHSGVEQRHYAGSESAIQMGAKAAQQAMANAGVTLAEVDCIVSASGGTHQIIPSNAALLQKELGGATSGIPCLDINTTCLSFVTALDTMSYLIAHGRYNKVLIITSEIASRALNWDDPASCTLFGDGAAAVVIGRTPAGEPARILSSAFKTYSAGATLAEIRGGGSGMYATAYRADRHADYLFKMDGPGIYKMAARYLPAITQDLLEHAQLTMAQIALVIPHQASILAMKLIQKRLGVLEERFMYTIARQGNTIAASIPMALHDAITQHRLQRGEYTMLLGTSAGVSIGGMILEY